LTEKEGSSETPSSQATTLASNLRLDTIQTDLSNLVIVDDITAKDLLLKPLLTVYHHPRF